MVPKGLQKGVFSIIEKQALVSTVASWTKSILLKKCKIPTVFTTA
jgi:hypothetical protein